MVQLRVIIIDNRANPDENDLQLQTETPMHRLHLPGTAAIATLLALHAPARAQEALTFRLTLNGSGFEPAEVQVPAGVRFVLVVRNESAAAAEFESKGLNAEKVISAGREAMIRVGPLAAGRYPFENEFNAGAKGAVVAVQKAGE